MPHHSPTLSRRSLVAIAATLTGGATLGLRSVLADSPDVAHGPSSADATPAPANGTSPAAATGSILDRAYDPGTGIDTKLSIIAMYADLDAETAALGLTRPGLNASDDEIAHWARMMTGVAFPQDVAYLLTPEWREYTGFDISQVSQTIEIGEPPATVAMYLGVFDRDTATSTWSEAGYEEIEDDGDIAIFSIAEEESLDLSNPIQKTFLSRRNNAAIIGNELVIFCSRLDLIREAVATAIGETNSLGSAPGVAVLTANTPKLASGAFAPGSSFQGLSVGALGDLPDELATAIAEQQSQEQMPAIVLGQIGVTPGGPLPTGDITDEATPVPTPKTATLEISLLFLSQAEAEQAIAVADERLKTAVSLRTAEPFSEYFKSWELSVAQDDPVARLSFELRNALPKIWMDLLFARDLPFIG